MFKKITAICLTFILVMTIAIIPVFALDYQNTTTIQNQASAVRYDKKDKSDKADDDDAEDILKDMVKKFLDSNEFNWAEKSIEKMGLMGILNGTGNGYFNPKNNVTHVEAIAMVLKLTGYQEEAEAIKAEPAYFKGKSDKWSYGYLQLALDKGIIIPSEDGQLNPKTPAKRYEVAKYVVRALGKRATALKNMNAKLSYKDAASISDSSIGYVYVATDLGIMQGSNNLFQPNKPITRAELAVILDKAEGNTEEPGNTSNSVEGKFIEFDKNDLEITLNVNNESVVYDVNTNAPVYRNSKYYSVSSLDAGDVIRLILDNRKKVIFIEFIQTATIEPTEEALSATEMEYSNLPKAIQDKVDALKETKNFAAFKLNGKIYLIATRGEMPTGGYTIGIDKVYKQTIATDEYNLKVVVEMANPGSSIVTQANTFPFTIVRLNYFDDIGKVKFVNASDTVLAQTTLKTIDEEEVTETISGKIYSVDTINKIVRLLENDGVRRSYSIPTGVRITLDARSVTLSALKPNMPAVITKINGVITKLAALSETDEIETINGKIDSVDVTGRIVRILESYNSIKSYYIPSNVAITLNNRAVSITSLAKDMTVVLTRTNGVITKLAATNIVETISGKIDSVDLTNKVVRLLESNNVVRAYTIPDAAQITLDNQTTDLQDLEKGMKAVITKSNGIITKLAVQRDIQTIEGVLITTYTNLSKTYISVKVGTAINAYEITSHTKVFYNNESSNIENIPLNSTLIIKVENAEVIEIRNK